MLTCTLLQRVPVLWCLGIYRHVQGWSALLGRFSMDSEAVEAGVLRVAPVGQNPELYYLEGLVRPFQCVEHLERVPFLVIGEPSQRLPFFLILRFQSIDCKVSGGTGDVTSR